MYHIYKLIHFSDFFNTLHSVFSRSFSFLAYRSLYKFVLSLEVDTLYGSGPNFYKKQTKPKRKFIFYLAI